MEREGVSTLSIHGFHGLLGTCSFLKFLVFVCLKSFEECLSAEIRFMVTIVSVLKSVIKRFENFCLKSIWKCGVKIGLSKYLTVIHLLEKWLFFSSYPLDRVILLLVSR